MTAVLDLPPLTVDRGEQDRRWRRIPARFSPACDEFENPEDRPFKERYDPLANYRDLYPTLEEAADFRIGPCHHGTILLVKCDGEGNPLVVEGVQDLYANDGAPRAARSWGKKWGVPVPEPIKDYSGHEVREYVPVMTEVAKPTGQTWRSCPETCRKHGS